MTEPALEFPRAAERAAPARLLLPRPYGLRALPGRPGEQAAAPATPRAEVRGRTIPGAGASLAVVPPRAVTRPAAAARRPVHVVVAVGMTAGLYAVSLAGVTALQAATDLKVAADRQPAANAVANLRDSHDALESRLTQLDDAYATAAGHYQSIAAGVTANEEALKSLGKQVKAAVGSASKMSISSARLPGVSSRTAYVSSKPAVNACTTASGNPC